MGFPCLAGKPAAQATHPPLLRISFLMTLTLSAPILLPAASTESLPNICDLKNEPMYCHCDVKDTDEMAKDVVCHIGKKLTPEHAVFSAFSTQNAITSLTFSAFGNEYHLDFIPEQVVREATLLEKLKFSQAKLGPLKTHSFYNLSKLTVLSLDSNGITNLESESIVNLPLLKKLELGDNNLTRIPARALLNLPSLTQLFLERNKLAFIEDHAFEDLGSVKELDLSDNAIENFTEHTFKGLSRLIRLDMFRNRLVRLAARVFSGMPMLSELDLKYNQISEVDPLAFDGMLHLTVIYLSHNRLRILPAHMFMGAPNLVTVDLSQNQLLTLTWRTVQDLRKIDAESFDMSLTGNKFSCDCRLAWILQLENATKNDKFRRELRHIKCDFVSPGNASSSKVARLSLKRLGCPADYVKPDFSKKVLRTSLTTAAQEDADGHTGEGNRIHGSVTAVPSKPVEEDAEDGPSMKNDIEVVLSQQKAPETKAAPSRKRKGNSASALSGCEGLCWTVLVISCTSPLISGRR